LNYQTNLAYAYDDWYDNKSYKNNVMAFVRRKSHAIVETRNGEIEMKNQKEMNDASKKAVIFVRVSSREQQGGYSIEA